MASPTTSSTTSTSTTTPQSIITINISISENEKNKIFGNSNNFFVGNNKNSETFNVIY